MRIVYLIFCLLIISGCEKKEEDKIFAIVNGEIIKGRDFLPRLQTDYQKIRDPEMRKGLVKQALDELTTQRIIRKEAKKIGIKPNEIFDLFVHAKEKKLMTEQQLEIAKGKYIVELRSRSKIIIFDPPK